ncbi:MAG: 50S ribosomal protein L15 [Acidobacteriia bacterium]|nr:50S ribosomal protein L15 [Terriglobia bacterium]
MDLSSLRPPKGATHHDKRRGRGMGSGLGRTAGRGEKGQKSRSGYRSKRGFEGGQMPLHRRLPKRGFTNIFRKEIAVVNVESLNRFNDGERITPERLVESGVLKALKDGVKILGDGELKRKLTVVAHMFSETARAKIVGAGGAAEVLAAPPVKRPQRNA